MCTVHTLINLHQMLANMNIPVFSIFAGLLILFCSVQCFSYLAKRCQKDTSTKSFIMFFFCFVAADTSAKSDLSANTVDARVSLVKDDHAVISQFVRSLFTVLYEVLQVFLFNLCLASEH